MNEDFFDVINDPDISQTTNNRRNVGNNILFGMADGATER
jgi:hypothetical protein